MVFPKSFDWWLYLTSPIVTTMNTSFHFDGQHTSTCIVTNSVLIELLDFDTRFTKGHAIFIPLMKLMTDTWLKP
jgi:hypothetical protein